MKQHTTDSIIKRVQTAAELHPNSIALINESTGEKFTYAEVMDMVNVLAKQLKVLLEKSDIIINSRQGGITPLVCILMDRSYLHIVAILAVLSVGAAYVPIDPSFPQDRQFHILTHSKCPVALVEPRFVEELQQMGTQGFQLPEVMVVDRAMLSTKHDSSRQEPVFTSQDNSKLAYVLYTSGSTGKPKGVMVRDSSVCNLIQHFVTELQVTTNDAVLGLTTFCFDISVLEIFVPLFCGATLVLVSSRTQKNPFAIVKTLQQYQVTIFQATPTTYEMLLSSGWQGDMNLLCLVGGEACRPSVAALAGQVKALYNVYGPTETTIWSSCKLLTPDKAEDYQKGVVPVGGPISRTSFHLVVSEENRHHEEIIGEGEGELWIGGDGVALGYLHAPELTAERFVVNPFPGPYCGKMAYRTGDLFRRTVDGEYVFVRRLDDQVKVNGYRIELGEVERACLLCEGVKQVLAVVVEDVLAVLITANEDSLMKFSSMDETELRNTVRRAASTLVPPYMLPTIVQAADHMPTTANGKLDRRAAAAIITEGIKKNKGHDNSISVEERAPQKESTEPITASSTTAAGTTKPRRSMTSFVMDLAFTVSGQQLFTPSASFVALGIDSFAAALFRRSLEVSLDGHTKGLDGSLLYDPDTTVASFSVLLFNHMLKQAPQKLEELGIDRAIDEDNGKMNKKQSRNKKKTKQQIVDLDALEEGVAVSDDECDEDDYEDEQKGSEKFDLQRQQQQQQDEEDMLLRRVALSKTQLLDGFRGFVAILIICDHFFANKAQLGNRFIADTTYFVIITGFATGLQDATAVKTAVWKPFSYLYGRFLGLFPIYWLILLLTGPFIYLKFPGTVQQSQLGGLLVLYATGLQEWTPWCATLLINVYYVSVLWGVFLMYCCMKTTWVWSKNLHLSVRLLMTCSWLGFIAGMDYYIRKEGALALHAPMACVYFGVTFFSVYLGLKPMLRIYRRLLVVYADLPLVRYVPGVMTDVITAVLMFTSFGITKESGNTFLTDKTTAEVKSGMQFTFFNQFMLYFGNPLLFLSIVLFAFVQPEQKHFRPSFLNYFLVNSRIMGLLGRCSLAIYLCQLTFMNCYYPLVIAGIQHHHYPYTRSFAAEYDNSSFAESRKAKYYFPGIILIVLVGIFIQKVYQDQLIVRLHLWFVQWSQKRRAAALSSSSITPQAQAPVIQGL